MSPYGSFLQGLWSLSGPWALTCTEAFSGRSVTEQSCLGLAREPSPGMGAGREHPVRGEQCLEDKVGAAGLCRGQRGCWWRLRAEGLLLVPAQPLVVTGVRHGLPAFAFLSAAWGKVGIVAPRIPAGPNLL